MGETERKPEGARRAHFARRVGPGRFVSRAGRGLDAVSASVVEWLLPSVVLLSVLAVGTVHRPTLWGVSALCLPLVVVGLRAPGGGWTPEASLLGLLVAYTALQALPLPAEVVAAVSPETASIWARALHPLGEAGPRWVSFSLEPGATAIEALKLWCYLGVALAAGAYGRQHGARRVAILGLGAASCVALVTLLHGLFGASKLYGLYAPTPGPVRFALSPLLNPNNLSGYLNVGALLGAGLALAEGPRGLRATSGLCAAICMATSVLSGSRGGVLALVVFGFLGLVLGVLQRLRRNRHRNSSVVSAAVAVAAGVGLLAFGAGLAALGFTPAVRSELWNDNVEKLGVLAATRSLIEDHARVGIGRGAFESVYPAYDPEGDNVVFAFAESFPLQWCAEWGVPVTLLALGGALYATWPSAKSALRDTVALGVLTGIGALLAQNLLDLALELPSVAILLTALWAGLGGAARSRQGESPWHVPRSRVVALGSIGGLAWALLFVWAPSPVSAARREAYTLLRESRIAEPGAFEALTRSYRRYLLRHPAEPYFPYLGGEAAARAGDPSALRWLGRALERRPNGGDVHLALGEELWRRGAKRQALLELRTATELAPRLAERVASRAVAWRLFPEDAGALVPTGGAGVRVLLALARAYPPDTHRDARIAFVESALERDGDRAELHEALASELRDASAGRSEPCADETAAEACRVRALGHAERAVELEPERAEALVLCAELSSPGEPKRAALAVLRARCPSSSWTARCYQGAIGVALSLADETAVAELVEAYLSAACSAREACAHANRHLARTYELLGRPHKELLHRERAARHDPSVDSWVDVARAAKRATLEDAVDRALDKARLLARGTSRAAEVEGVAVELGRGKRGTPAGADE